MSLFDELSDDSNESEEEYLDPYSNADQPARARDEYDLVEEKSARGNTRKRSRFLGMTPPQWFFLAVLLFLATSILGVAFLLVTGTIIL